MAETERLEKQSPRNSSPELSAHEHLIGKEAQLMHRQEPSLPPDMPSNACLLAKMFGFGPHSARTAPVMAAVERNTAEAQSLFPNDKDTGDYLSDLQLPGNAAYRYLMNKEGLDDYSSTSAADIAQLEATRPGTVRELDNFIADQIKQGLVPQDTVKQCLQ